MNLFINKFSAGQSWKKKRKLVELNGKTNRIDSIYS